MVSMNTRRSVDQRLGGFAQLAQQVEMLSLMTACYIQPTRLGTQPASMQRDFRSVGRRVTRHSLCAGFPAGLRAAEPDGRQRIPSNLSLH